MAVQGTLTNNRVDSPDYTGASKLYDAIKNYNANVSKGWNVPYVSSVKSNSGGSSSNKMTLNDYYNSILGSLGSSAITPEKIGYDSLGYDMPTESEIAGKVSEYLRPGYDRAISARRAQTGQNRAAIDIDAASRGMGASTWVTDAKTRQMNAEAADIAGLESDYNANLAQNVYNMYNQHLTNKMNVDMFDKSNQLAVDEQNVANALAAAQWNEQMRRALEETAYSRALNAYNLAKSRGGSGITKDQTDVTIK